MFLGFFPGFYFFIFYFFLPPSTSVVKENAALLFCFENPEMFVDYFVDFPSACWLID